MCDCHQCNQSLEDNARMADMADEVKPYTREEMGDPLIDARIGYLIEYLKACPDSEAMVETAERLLATVRAGLEAQRRIDALRRHITDEGTAALVVFSDDSWEISGVYDDDREMEDGIPARFASFDDLLSTLARPVTQRSGLPHDSEKKA